jgi:hypothetical protein
MPENKEEESGKNAQDSPPSGPVPWPPTSAPPVLTTVLSYSILTENTGESKNISRSS